MQNQIENLTYQQIKDILNQQIELRTRALIVFQYASAARIGELLWYKHKNGQITHGLIKSNININEEGIYWKLPNFKVKNEKKKTKYPFILKEETPFYDIAKEWIVNSSEQIFELRESMARKLIREVLKPFGYGSHVLRKSRATHMAKWGFTVYEIMEYLGHTKMETGMAYVSTSNMADKIKENLPK